MKSFNEAMKNGIQEIHSNKRNIFLATEQCFFAGMLLNLDTGFMRMVV